MKKILLGIFILSTMAKASISEEQKAVASINARYYNEALKLERGMVYEISDRMVIELFESRYGVAVYIEGIPYEDKANVSIEEFLAEKNYDELITDSYDVIGGWE